MSDGQYYAVATLGSGKTLEMEGPLTECVEWTETIKQLNKNAEISIKRKESESERVQNQLRD